VLGRAIEIRDDDGLVDIDRLSLAIAARRTRTGIASA
jgi:hypothetical protein